MPNIFVASIPKAGTFYMMTLLENLGYDVRPYQYLQSGKILNWETDSKINYSQVTDSVMCTHVAPSYMPDDDHITIFMYRDLKECCVSLAKWCKSTRQWGMVPQRLEGVALTEYILSKHIERYEKMIAKSIRWMSTDSGATKINYNDVDYGGVAKALGKTPEEITKASDQALKMDSRTRSPKRSIVNDKTWSPKCESLFQHYLGGHYDKMGR